MILGIFTWLLNSRLARWAALAGAALLVLWRVVARIKRGERNRIEKEALEDAFNQIDDADRARRDAERDAASGGLRRDDGYKRE